MAAKSRAKTPGRSTGFQDALNRQSPAGAPPGFDDALTAHGSAIGGIQFAHDTARIPLFYVDPLLDQILTLFPSDNLRELNRRYRHYYRYHPMVRSIIDYHTETPLSDFELHVPEDAGVQRDMNEFKNRLNLFSYAIDLSRDRWLLGESFGYGNWDAHAMEFNSFVQFPPEEVMIAGAYTDPERVYRLRPNQEVRRTLNSTNPADQVVASQMKKHSPKMSRAIATNQEFPLDAARLIVLQNRMARYITRGVSPLMAAVKDLLYEDQLILFRNSFIQRQSSPLNLYKVGSAEKGWIPSKKMMAEFRANLMQAQGDPAFNLITHPFVTIESYTGHDKILPLIPQFDHVQKRVFMALFVSEAIISGEKTPYASGLMFMRGLMNRYQTHRNDLQLAFQNHIFAPLARAWGAYKVTTAETSHRVRTRRDYKKLLVPTIRWEKANLLANQSIMQMVIGLEAQEKIPSRYLYEMFGWRLEDVVRDLERESETRIDPLWRAVRKKVVEGSAAISQRVALGESVDEAIKHVLSEEATKESEEPAKNKKDDKGEIGRAHV